MRKISRSIQFWKSTQWIEHDREMKRIEVTPENSKYKPSQEIPRPDAEMHRYTIPDDIDAETEWISALYRAANSEP